MNSYHAAWLAALIEGEGWVGRRAIQIEMADQDVVERAAEIMKSKSVRTRVRGGNKRTWRADVYGETAIQVMRDVLPYMGIRRAAKMRDSLDETRD
ncbi:hypothetical protein [Fodinicola feengrottensis]|uniref:Homing endonuclease LAGLIDADG domain-containing protein n=1 Tax=Fodinicola feengrottensis TaxID=435914 RepID=A0ABP4UCY5_9ACTN|nr:hypothetical protein [Fodinicola feengrottensis]